MKLVVIAAVCALLVVVFAAYPPFPVWIAHWADKRKAKREARRMPTATAHRRVYDPPMGCVRCGATIGESEFWARGMCSRCCTPRKFA